jgi:hypothetical protein
MIINIELGLLKRLCKYYIEKLMLLFLSYSEKNIQEEEKENRINWDNYFTRDQAVFYERLYETEPFDRGDSKLVKRYKSLKN